MNVALVHYWLVNDRGGLGHFLRGTFRKVADRPEAVFWVANHIFKEGVCGFSRTNNNAWNAAVSEPGKKFPEKDAVNRNQKQTAHIGAYKDTSGIEIVRGPITEICKSNGDEDRADCIK